MKEQDRKLAEEIYFDLCDRFIDTISREQIVFMAMQAYHEAKMKEEKAKKFYNKNTCVVCHQNYVDSANGFDTCDYCLNRI